MRGMARRKSRKGIGGPKKTGLPVRSQQVKSGVTPDEKATVLEFASAHGMTESEVVRVHVVEVAKLWKVGT